MDNTRIDWADMSWNPVTGCLHNCEYCYARRIAERFGLAFAPKLGDSGMEGAAKYDSPAGMDTMLELEKPYTANGKAQPYPMAFLPTFHRYRLGEPARKTRPRNIFVCSMADLLGRWVPTRWIVDVLDACRTAPQHNYLFLTKNPRRYLELDQVALLPRESNFWYGSTVTTPDMPFFCSDQHKTFLSIEPLLGPLGKAGNADLPSANWVIIGAMTGPGAEKHQPKREWVEEIVNECRERSIPVFMKDNLVGAWGDELIREFPAELRKEAANGR